jgi:hypothetical protein
MRQNYIKLTRRNPIIAVLHLEITVCLQQCLVVEAFEKFNGYQKKLHSVLCSIVRDDTTTVNISSLYSTIWNSTCNPCFSTFDQIFFYVSWITNSFFCYPLKLNFICYLNRFFTFDYSLYIYKMILLKLLHIYRNICHIMVAVINWHYISLLSIHPLILEEQNSFKIIKT